MPLGDSALVVSFGETIDDEIHAQVLGLSHRLEVAPPLGIVDYVPAYATVTIQYDPLDQDYESFVQSIRALMAGSTPDRSPTLHNDVVIPVCYDGEFGPDLDFVAAHNDMTPADVVHLHSSASYVVYMIGFAPGFPYLGGLPPVLATPRLEEPRAIVPVGSVGIAGAQTGVYPIATPGGWRIIGRTPLRLFDPAADDPSLLHPGDGVTFAPIDRAEFDRFTADGAP